MARQWAWRLRWHALLWAGVLVLFLPVLAHWRLRGDFEPHTAYIVRMLAGEVSLTAELPNFLWHVSAGVPYALIGGAPLDMYTTLASLLWYGALASVIFYALCLAWGVPSASLNGRDALLLCVLSWALMLVAPLHNPATDNAYFGFIYPYVYHNPTMIPLRPTSLLLFLACVWAFEAQVRPSWGQVLAVAGLALANIWAKPSYALVLLPSLGVLGLERLLRRRYIGWRMLVLGVGVPMVGLLGAQALSYQAGGMQFAPFLTYELWAYHYEPNANQHLLLKLLASLAFPLAVYGLYLRQAIRELALNFAWLGMGAGLAFTYLFVDSGDPVAGNLAWNGQIALMVLFVASGAFFLRMARLHALHARLWVGAGVLGLHVVSGLWWYATHLTTDYLDLIYRVW